MKQSTAKYILVLVITCVALGMQVSAQGGPGPPAPNPQPGDIPIDGGVIALLIAGLGYGARKLYMQNKDEDETNS